MTAVATTQERRVSLVERMADKYSLDPSKMMHALKETAFKGNVTNEQMMALLVVADQYNLNPWLKQIYAFPDKGGIVPVVGVDGWARIINEHPQFDGIEFQMDADGTECTCTIHRKDRAHPTQVTEYMSECRRDTQPWRSHPRRMLRHKTMIQAARMAFGYGGIYDQDEAERIVVDVTPAPAAPTGPKLADKIKAAANRKSAPAPAPEVIDMETGEMQAEDVDDFVAAMEAEEAAQQ